MQKIAAILLLCILAGNVWGQEPATITIGGNGTSTSYGQNLPVNIYFKNSISEQVYTKSEINEQGRTSGSITKIAFQYASSTNSRRNIDAEVGKYYMVVVANYSRCNGYITFEKLEGDGEANCDIVTNCNITSITAATTCLESGTYKLTGLVTYTDIPTVGGTITLTDGTTTIDTWSVNAGDGTHSYTYQSLTANGSSHTLTATFEPTSSSQSSCEKISVYTAPSNCGGSSLPITLLKFTAKCHGSAIETQWITASERDNAHFIVERSADALNFTEIAKIKGAGNSIDELVYRYIDSKTLEGTNYYRLRQVDYDGNSTVSEIIVADCYDNTSKPEVVAFPNPFSSELTVMLENFDNTPARVEIYNMLGTLVRTVNIGNPSNEHATSFDFENLPDATYTLRVSTDSFVINKRIVKN